MLFVVYLPFDILFRLYTLLTFHIVDFSLFPFPFSLFPFPYRERMGSVLRDLQCWLLSPRVKTTSTAL